jgi:hypothetical protein
MDATAVSHEAFLQEGPLQYGAFHDSVFEISLRAAEGSDWLQHLSGAHRVVQALFQGELLGQYELLDFLLWPQALFARVRMRERENLSNFLGLLHSRTVPAGEAVRSYWAEEPLWIKWVGPEGLADSTQEFLAKSRELRLEAGGLGADDPSLFFLYRNPRLKA